MQHRFRFTAAIAVALGCAALLPVAGVVHAQGVTVALYPASQTVAPGDQFDIELRVTQAGSAFNGFDAQVSYDATELTLQASSPTSLQQGTLLTDACGSTFHRFLAGAATDTITDVLLCNGASVTGPGQIYKLHFQASNNVGVTHVTFVAGTLRFYSGGLFVTPVSSSDAVVNVGTTSVGGPDAGGPALTASPNPGRGSILFTSGIRTNGPESLTVRDVQGRIVQVLGVAGHRVTWDGRRTGGESAPDGIYFATLHAGGRATTIRFSWLH
jgi:hypothetical protein